MPTLDPTAHVLHQIQTMTSEQAGELEDAYAATTVDTFDGVITNPKAVIHRHHALAAIEDAEAQDPHAMVRRQEAQGASPDQGVLVLMAVDDAIRSAAAAGVLTDEGWEAMVGIWENVMGAVPRPAREGA